MNPYIFAIHGHASQPFDRLGQALTSQRTQRTGHHPKGTGHLHVWFFVFYEILTTSLARRRVGQPVGFDIVFAVDVRNGKLE